MKENPAFQLYGIFGYPLAHTLSPRMQEAGFCELGLKAFYLPFAAKPAEFRHVMRSLKRVNLDGFNVTVPHKEAALRYAPKKSAEAKAIGAANTLVRQGKAWVAANTDAYGFLRSLKDDAGYSPRGKSFLILGAGGGARAVVYALASSGAKRITLVNRHAARAQSLIRFFSAKFPRVKFQAQALAKADFKTLFEQHDAAVQTTSVGLKHSDPLLFDAGALPNAVKGRKKFFVDLIYRPAETLFLKTAREKGHTTLNGMGMLVYQGAKSFEYWTGRKAPVQVMRRTLEQALGAAA